jgi:hypothetical protein
VLASSTTDADATHLRPHTKEGEFLGNETLEGGDEGPEDIRTGILSVVAVPDLAHEFSIGT